MNSEDAKTRRKVNSGTVRCTVHKIEFSATGENLETWTLYCPACNAVELKGLRAQLAEAVSHRDSLLKAIEIKQLLTPLYC